MKNLEKSQWNGIVVSKKANYLEVEINNLQDEKLSLQICSKPQRFLCTRRRKLDYKGTNIFVGDRVSIESPDFKHLRAVINDVSPRKNCIDRPQVANITKIFIVLAFENPRFDFFQACRFLLKAEEMACKVGLILTKMDLLKEDQIDKYLARLTSWGYKPLPVSLKTGQGLDLLKKDLLSNELSVMCGPSGVGKSSLLNHYFPEAELRTGSLSSKLQRGKNTTRNVQLLSFSRAARVADTPGFNLPELKISPIELANLFPEIRAQLAIKNCRFRNCLHREEPGCAVNREWDRYSFYLNSLADLMLITRSHRAD